MVFKVKFAWNFWVAIIITICTIWKWISLFQLSGNFKKFKITILCICNWLIQKNVTFKFKGFFEKNDTNQKL
jgi:hypothetical protein